eukprot:gene5190-8796_t
MLWWRHDFDNFCNTASYSLSSAERQCPCRPSLSDDVLTIVSQSLSIPIITKAHIAFVQTASGVLGHNVVLDSFLTQKIWKSLGHLASPSLKLYSSQFRPITKTQWENLPPDVDVVITFHAKNITRDLEKITNRPYRFVHMIRDPVDAVVSAFLYELQRTNVHDHFHKIVSAGNSTTTLLAMAKEMQQELLDMEQQYLYSDADHNALNVKLEDFSSNFTDTVRRIFHFLDVPKNKIEAFVANAQKQDTHRVPNIILSDHVTSGKYNKSNFQLVIPTSSSTVVNIIRTPTVAIIYNRQYNDSSLHSNDENQDLLSWPFQDGWLLEATKTDVFTLVETSSNVGSLANAANDNDESTGESNGVLAAPALAPCIKRSLPLVTICTAGLIILPLVDTVIDNRTLPLSRSFYAVLDNVTHGAVAYMLWLLAIPYQCKSCFQMEALASGTVACIIDIDHFIHAHSLSIQAATSLHSRPFLHSLPVALAVSLLVTATLLRCTLLSSCFGRSVLQQNESVTSKKTTMMWLALTASAIISHHIRDAYRRGLWINFGPVNFTVPISYLAYLCFLVFHAVVLFVFGTWRSRRYYGCSDIQYLVEQHGTNAAAKKITIPPAESLSTKTVISV